ncbi:T9SS type A sorting domain-containing protein [Rufibacter radiotolerans]|uniref:T9SS type A sorting domain-containing protein n=1 Tax=Rufibacter radiotolerans TaxID=1379910 RepID=UPI0006645695|nr:T9SS type A sorting domain-containing protein [Rufibacter radiotolerans]
MKLTATNSLAIFSKILFFIIFFTTYLSFKSTAQISLGTKYTQNFDGLPATAPFMVMDGSNNGSPVVYNNSVAWINDTYVRGWYAAMNTTTTPLQYSSSSNPVYEFKNKKYTIGNGIVGMGSPGELSLGSYTAQENANAETGDIFYGVRFKNTSSKIITFIELNFRLEQWLDADLQSNLLLDYQVSSTPITDLKAGTWTNVGGSTLMVAPQDNVNNASNADLTPVNGNVVFKDITVTIGSLANSPFVALAVLPGQEIMIRWADLAGTQNAGKKDILTIDNLVVTPYGEDAVPLPVTLTSFNSKNKDGKVDLTWTTASEKDNDYFLVERSSDGKAFHAIGQVKGSGTSNVQRSYTFTDPSANAGTSYYRLKQVDFDGKSELSKVIAHTLGKLNAAAALQVGRNPFQQQLAYSVQSPAATEAVVELRNMQGKVFHTEKVALATGTSQLEISTATLPQGVYILSVTGTDLRVSQRVMKIQ